MRGRALGAAIAALAAAGLGASAARGQTADASVRARCADAALRAARLAAMRNERERGIMALELADLRHSIDMSPDGRFMVTTAMGSDVRIWEVATGVFHRRLGQNARAPR